MCVILDASARDDAFGNRRTRAGEQFFRWLERPRARLVLGGKLTEELASSDSFAKWAETAIADGRIRSFNPTEVGAEAESLAANWHGSSNDQHVIALARVSRARILYAIDGDLCEDFKDSRLVSTPRGRVYPTGDSQNAARRRRQLLNQTNLCPNR